MSLNLHHFFLKSLYIPPLERFVWLLGRMGHTTVHAEEGGMHRHSISIWFGFPDSSVGKESACNAGSERSAREGIGYPLQYSWAYLAAQLIKNPLAVWETWVKSLGWEDPLETAKTTYSSILAWRSPWTV